MTNNGRVIKMPFYYNGKAVSKEVWEKCGPELKKKIIKQNKEKQMLDNKVTGLYVVNDSFGIDKNTGRLMVQLRCEVENMSLFYVYASCKSFDMKNVEPVDFHLDFMKNGTWDTIHVPYNVDLFKGITDMASEIFLEIMAAEPRAGAGA
jgi:hypothetical protein